MAVCNNEICAVQIDFEQNHLQLPMLQAERNSSYTSRAMYYGYCKLFLLHKYANNFAIHKAIIVWTLVSHPDIVPRIERGRGRAEIH